MNDNYHYACGVSYPTQATRRRAQADEYAHHICVARNPPPYNSIYDEFITKLSKKVKSDLRTLETRKDFIARRDELRDELAKKHFYGNNDPSTTTLEEFLAQSETCHQLECYFCKSGYKDYQDHPKVPARPKKNKKPRWKYIAPPPTVEVAVKPKEIPKEALYKIIIITGNKPNSGTAANVCVNLEDYKKHLLGKQPLRRKCSVKFKFQQNSKEIFYVKGRKLGQLSRLAIEHDGEELEDAWFLKEVTVIPLHGCEEVVTEDHQAVMYYFECNDWIVYDERRDAPAKRYFIAKPVLRPTRSYRLKLKTGSYEGNTTTGSVYLTIYGSKGVTPKFKLDSEEKELFKQDKWDKFEVMSETDVGRVSRIEVEHVDDHGDGSVWLLEEAIVEDAERDQAFKFPCGQWFSKKGGKRTVREFYPFTDDKRGSIKGIKRLIRYDVLVVTGRRRFAGTDAHVFITVLGEKGSSEEVELIPTDKSIDPFEAGQTDEFTVRARDVGAVQALHIRHDNSGAGPGWFLETLTLRQYLPKLEQSKRLHTQGSYDGQRTSRGPKAADEDSLSEDDDLMGSMVSFGSNSSAIRKSSKQHSDRRGKSLHGSLADSDEDLKKDRKKKDRKLDGEDEWSDDAMLSNSRRRGSTQSSSQKQSRRTSQSPFMGRFRKNRTLSEIAEENDDEEFELAGDLHRRRSSSATLGRSVSRMTEDFDSQDESEEELYERRKHKHARKSKHGSSDSDDSEDVTYNRKDKHRRKSKHSSSDSDDSDVYYSITDRHRRKSKHMRKSKHSSSDSDDSSDDTYYRKNDQHSHNVPSIDSDDQHKHRRRRTPKENVSDESENGGYDQVHHRSSKKKSALPLYDEYFFECHKWLATDEGDKQIERMLKPSKVTAVNKVGGSK